MWQSTQLARVWVVASFPTGEKHETAQRNEVRMYLVTEHLSIPTSLSALPAS